MRTRTLLCWILFYSATQSLPADSVLLIIADDLGRDSLARFNDDATASIPPTPTIDRLAETGIQFNRMYAYSSCSPTRASILTGRYDFRTGVLSPEMNTLQANEFTLAEAIVASGAIGQRLAHLGKWHLGNSEDAPNTIGGWPHFAGALSGGLSDYSRWTKVVNGVSNNRYTTYATTDLVDDAIDWIEDQGSEDWFLWVAFNAPHTPLHKPDDALHDYDTLDGSEADIIANPRPYYEAMVQAMDTELADLLDVVDLETTTVIFIGDNGTPGSVVQPPFSQRHGKGSLYEGGVNVPMIISGAAVSEDQKNSSSDAIVHTVDLYRTILDLLSINQEDLLPETLVFDSQSFYSLLGSTQAAHTREFAYAGQLSSTPNGRNLMLTNTNYKWILNEDGSEEFYALSDGLSETRNRINRLDNEALDALAQFQIEEIALNNTPTVHHTYFDETGQFTIEIGWFANANLALKQSADLSNDSWQTAENVTISDNGDSVLTIKDTAALDSSQFYRIESH